jgi:hypothetical protein
VWCPRENEKKDRNIRNKEAYISVTNTSDPVESAMALNSQTRVTPRPSARAVLEAEARERLRQALPATVDHLRTHQAGRIEDSDIDAYVKLNWLEWHGGGLRLTITGRNVCAQVTPSAA